MLKLGVGLLWLLATYILLISGTYILKVFYFDASRSPPNPADRPAPPANEFKPLTLGKSPFALFDYNAPTGRNCNNIVLFVSTIPSFSLQKGTYRELREAAYAPMLLYMIKPKSPLFTPTIQNIQIIGSQLDKLIGQLTHIRSEKPTKIMLIVTDFGSQAIYNYLATISLNNVRLIDSVLCINPPLPSSALFMEDYFFMKKTRKLLELRNESIAHIKFVYFSSSQTEEFETCYSKDKCFYYQSLELWGIYSYFDSTTKFLTKSILLNLMGGYFMKSFSQPLNNKKIDHYFRYGQGKRMGYIPMELVRERCITPLKISFSNKEQSIVTKSTCILISVSSPRPRSLLIKSPTVLSVSIDEAEIVQYHSGQVSFLYLLQRTQNIGDVCVFNPNSHQITISYTKILTITEEFLRNGFSNQPFFSIESARIIKLPKMPVRVCTNNQFDYPKLDKSLCLDAEGQTIFRDKTQQITFSINNRQYYSQMFRKYQPFNTALIYLGVLALNILRTEYAELFVFNVLLLWVSVWKATLIQLTLYCLFMLSLSSVIQRIANKLVEYRNKIEFKPSLEASLMVLPFVLMISRFINLQVHFSVEWVSLALAFIVIIKSEFQVICLFLVFINWNYMLDTQLNYHMVLMTMLIYALYFQGEAYFYEKENFQMITLWYYIILVMFCWQSSALISIVTEVYTVLVMLVIGMFNYRNEKILRRLNSRLQSTSAKK